MTSDLDFLIRFEAAAIPLVAWTHEAHVRMAYLVLQGRTFQDALARIRTGIIRLNEAHGVENSESSGYHETLTVAWTHLVGDAIARTGPATSFAGFVVRNPELLSRERVLRHYSRERILSERARLEFVAPDRLALPGRSWPTR